MLVAAVAEHIVLGEIMKAGYAEKNHGEDSPLFTKLDYMTTQMAMIGIMVIFIGFLVFIFKDLATRPRKPHPLRVTIGDFIYAIASLAVAIPDGLPLALTDDFASSLTLSPMRHSGFMNMAPDAKLSQSGRLDAKCQVLILSNCKYPITYQTAEKARELNDKIV
jgi:hypothetical protein